MKRVQMFRTSDGEHHPSVGAAKTHAERRYGDHLTKLAHEAVRCEKYTTMVDWLDKNHGRVAELVALKQDIRLEADDAEDQ